MKLTSVKEFMNEHYIEKINEGDKEAQLYKKLISTLKKENITYKIDDSKTIGQPRVIIGKYVIGSGTVYHNEYTIYKNKKELGSYNSITGILDYISNINEAKFKAPKDFKELQKRVKNGEIFQLDMHDDKVYYLDIDNKGVIFIVDENGKYEKYLDVIADQEQFEQIGLDKEYSYIK